MNPEQPFREKVHEIIEARNSHTLCEFEAMEKMLRLIRKYYRRKDRL